MIKNHAFFALALFFGLAACKNQNNYEVPDTYSFDNVNFSGQTDRLSMLDELITYMKTAKNGAQLDAVILRDYFRNTNNPFTTTFTKNLQSKTFPLDSSLVVAYLDSAALASASGTPGSQGVAGILTSSSDPTKKYLVGPDGKDLVEVIEKMIMGACFYYQATSVYLSEDGIGDAVDNGTVVPGEGTAMEHHFDEAFGYLGVPIDYPANTNGLFFFGEYLESRDAVVKMADDMMLYFRTGRAAISNEDYETRDEMVGNIRGQWEKLIATCAIHYLNSSKTNFADDAKRCHALTEAWGFIRMLKYNEAKSVSQPIIDGWLAPLNNGLYSITIAELDIIRDEMATAFGLELAKDLL